MFRKLWSVILSSEWFTKPRSSFDRIGLVALLFIVSLTNCEYAAAADWEASIQSLVNAFVSRVLPTIALGYVAKNALSHIQNKPEARDESVRVALGVVSLIGIKGVWGWLQAQVR